MVVTRDDNGNERKAEVLSGRIGLVTDRVCIHDSLRLNAAGKVPIVDGRRYAVKHHYDSRGHPSLCIPFPLRPS